MGHGTLGKDPFSLFIACFDEGWARVMGGTGVGGGVLLVPFQVVEALGKTQVTYASLFVRIFISSSVVWAARSPLSASPRMFIALLQCELVLPLPASHICIANTGNEFAKFPDSVSDVNFTKLHVTEDFSVFVCFLHFI